VLGLCRRFGCVPGEAYAMDAHVLHLLEIERLTAPEQPEGGEESSW
jgi:hypothetical protein